MNTYDENRTVHTQATKLCMSLVAFCIFLVRERGGDKNLALGTCCMR